LHNTDPYADGNTAPSEKELWFKKNQYVPPDHTTAPQIKTVPSLTGKDTTVYVPPSTTEFRAQTTHGEHLPIYKAPDHATNIPVIKEKVATVNPGVWKPDYSESVPVQKEKADATRAPGYRAPDHEHNIPILKESAEAGRAPAYKAPDHVSGIPIVKEAVGPVNPGMWKPDYSDSVPVVKERPDASGTPAYQPPPTSVPVLREHAVAAPHHGYQAPDHTKPVPVIKTVTSADGSDHKVYVEPGKGQPKEETPSPRGTHLKKYQAPDHTSGIPVIKEDPTKYKGYVQW